MEDLLRGGGGEEGAEESLRAVSSLVLRLCLRTVLRWLSSLSFRSWGKASTELMNDWTAVLACSYPEQ
jgi:hypothetical protein